MSGCALLSLPPLLLLLLLSLPPLLLSLPPLLLSLLLLLLSLLLLADLQRRSSLLYRLFFVFGSDGLRSLYRAREADASFTEATRTLLSLKLPSEALGGQVWRRFCACVRVRL